MDGPKRCYACGICGNGYLRTWNDPNRICERCDKKGLRHVFEKERNEKMIKRFEIWREKLQFWIESERRYYGVIYYR